MKDILQFVLGPKDTRDVVHLGVHPNQVIEYRVQGCIHLDTMRALHLSQDRVQVEGWVLPQQVHQRLDVFFFFFFFVQSLFFFFLREREGKV